MTNECWSNVTRGFLAARYGSSAESRDVLFVLPTPLTPVPRNCVPCMNINRLAAAESRWTRSDSVKCNDDLGEIFGHCFM
jgi:hypothetical protein